MTINELLVRYLQHCDQYYRAADETPTGQEEVIRYALRPVMELYGHTLARDFGPLALNAVRSRMVEAGKSRWGVGDYADDQKSTKGLKFN